MKIGVMIFALLLLFNINFLKEQWKNIWTLTLYNIKYLKNFDITETILIFSVIVAFIIYWLTFKKGKGWLIYLVSIAVIIIGPIIGNPPDIIQVCLFVFFHIGTSVTGNMLSIKKKKNKSTIELINTAGIGALFTAIFFIFSLIVTYRITSNHMMTLFSIPIKLEEEIKEISTKLKVKKEIEGRVSRGNNNAKGVQKLEVTVSEKPDEIIYLKNFIGANYLDNKWEKDMWLNYSVDDNLEGDNIDALNYFDKQFYLTQNNEIVENQGLYIDSTQWLKVKHLNPEEEGFYIPYISQAQRMRKIEYTFSTYSQEKYLNALKNIDSQSFMWYKDVEEEEHKYAKEKYLNVTRERFPRLFELYQDNYIYGTDNITEFIKNTLWSSATYTLSPGIIPLNEEIPEYFLFESGKGYCVHFATTATLIYRMYGIPARYVTGYIAKPSQFVEESGGLYKATVTDREAHAWVEIYKEGYGWERVEVTPTINEVSSEINEEKNTVAEERTNTIPERINEEEIDNAENNLSINEDNNSNKNFKILLNIIKVLAIVLESLSAITAICYIVLLRRKKILKKYKKSYSDRLVTKIVEVLQFGGYVKEYTGMEPGFPEVIAEIVPQLSIEEAEQLIKSALQETFGNKHVSPEKTKKALNAYKNSCIFVYEGLPMWKKFYFKYIKAYW
ncbi:transglutaminase-like domain-containing protein [Clostridium sp.]|uniref:transglutaminase-like domain-containing protein n=1 Tax=Clostridium sp. TaxID=1506 RepID=UPI00290B08F2|nr:transglutaminase-like domain-containing protein [Clostridium sp.]MDU5105384.1 transglutaminase-like domain-containing protein [Clostridium sp.]